MIADLDARRVGWELIEDWDLYQCWGVGAPRSSSSRAAARTNAPIAASAASGPGGATATSRKAAAEIAWLHRAHGVNFIDLADENPTSSKRVWRAFLEALIAENVPVKLFATIRAPDIVRDADFLHLYRRAGIDCVLMGMETTDPETIAKIRKGSTTRGDAEAIRLLRRHGILSMVGHIVGFEQETFRDYWRALKQLILYDPDLLNAMYVTPHRWTGFYRDNGAPSSSKPDQARWDYRHQILGTRHLRPWQIFALVKLMEVIMHLRPRALRRDRLMRMPISGGRSAGACGIPRGSVSRKSANSAVAGDWPGGRPCAPSPAITSRRRRR